MEMHMSNAATKIVGFVLTFVLIFQVICSGISANAAEWNHELDGEIEVIFNRNEAEMTPYIEAFERKYPKVRVKYTCYDDLETELKARMETGDYGDVTYFPSFVATEEAPQYFEPLGSYEELDEKYNYINMGRHYDGKVYGIPSAAYFVGIVYNKEVFDKAGVSTLPKTIDEFLYAMYLINEHTDALPFYAGYTEPWVLGSWEVFPFIEMTGKASYKYNEFIMDKNPFREGTVHNQTLKLLYDLVEQGYTEVGKENLGWWDSIIRMNQGQVGCSVIGTWALNDYKNVGDGGDNIGFMPFPNQIDGNQYVTVTADYSYAVARNSNNKGAAKAFVAFMLDESGYAFDQDTISVLKTDPYPECYGDMTETVIQYSTSASGEAYALYSALSQNLNLYDTQEYVRIVEAAAGMTKESFDDVMDDWNTRWEAGRDGVNITVLPENTVEEEQVVEIANTKVEFSQNEQAFIEAHPTAKVGYHTTYAPLSYEENGEFKGIARDISDMISEKSGITMEYVGYENTDMLISALANGEIDFVAGMDNIDLVNSVKYSKSYLQYMDVLVRHNTVNVASLKRFSSVEGEKYLTLGNMYENISSSDLQDGIDKVEHLETDFIVTNYYSANYYMRKNQYDDLTVIPYVKNQTYHVAFDETTDPVLVAIVNKCIYSIPDGEVDIKLMEYMDEVVMDFNLLTFVKANPVISMFIMACVFMMIFAIMYERYRAKNKQALEAKKYAQLAALADEWFFEYNYKKEKMKIDAQFLTSIGVENAQEEDFENSRKYAEFMEQVRPALEEKQDAQFTISLDREEVGKQWYRVVTSVVLSHNKQPVHMLGKIINIQKEMEEVANYQNKAQRDNLTKLYNREGLYANLPKDANGVMLAVIDMDNFKQVNDTLGHDGGDYALMYFADKLEQYMGTKSLVSRYGGDEFIVFLTGVSQEEAKERLDDLVTAMDVDLRFAGNTHKVSVSAGAVYTESMESFEDLFHEADRMLYKTKDEGKNSYTFETIEKEE